MLKNNIKKIIISLIAMLLVVSVGYTVLATDGEDWLNELLQGDTGNAPGNENAEQIPEGTNNKVLNTNNNVNENRPATTPHAGVEGYAGLIFVAIFAVSAIYAYKKVREYNA